MNEQHGQTEESYVSVNSTNILGKTQTKTIKTVKVTDEDLNKILTHNRGNEKLAQQVEIFRQFRHARDESSTMASLGSYSADQIPQGSGGQADFDNWLERSDPTIHRRA
ncbi:hypothetical protein V866_002603 [Kwoniella sp. B9012]|uniref:Uncharacterized protein n=1 Tax=Kwoniella europaea PYCC6329 TaxID=1423913 RepID=A0AAX4KGH6_9TREE